MSNGSSCYVAGWLAAVLRFNRFLGLAPLQICRKEHAWRVSSSTLYSVIGSLVIIIANVAVIWISYIELQSGRLHPTTRRVAWAVGVFVVMITTDVMVYSALGLMRCLISSVNQVEEINYKMGAEYWPRLWSRKQSALFIIWIIFCISLTVADCTLKTIFSNPEERLFVGATEAMFNVYYWIIELGLVQFMFLVLHVRTAFQSVNDNLRLLIRATDANTKTDEIQVISEINIQSNSALKRVNNFVNPDGLKIEEENTTNCMIPYEMIRDISSSYASACDVVRAVDRSHGLVLMMLLSYIFLHLVTTPYYFIAKLFEVEDNSSDMNSTYVALDMFWCLYHIVNLMMTIEPCHVTHSEMAVTRKLVSHLMRRSDSVYDPLAIELEQFCKHLKLNAVYYKPLKVTTMTRGLFLTIVGSITTYLVIIVDIK